MKPTKCITESSENRIAQLSCHRNSILSSGKKHSPLITSLLLASYGLSGTASAANINHQGHGQALIYPYYTVNNNLNTLLSVVNTTSDVKAVRVRFLESDNGQDVLDFNLYMAPFDVWTAALSATETGAQLFTPDVSCVPFLGSPQPFLDFAFVLDPGSDAEEREREGHFEIIEMGTVIDSVLAPAATHVNGVPWNCDALNNAWLPGGQWFIDPTDGLAPASGGLTGDALIVDVAEGTAISYSAEAIDDFYAEGGFLHTQPGSLEPSMSTAEPKSLIVDSGRVIESEWSTGEDAISALFMFEKVFNEFVLGSGINARTEWVVTFPTKAFYVESGSSPVAPFTKTFSSPDGACEEIDEVNYDREERVLYNECGILCPPNFFKSLCWNSNVVQFYNSAAGTAAEAESPIFGSTNTIAINTNPFESGVTELMFPTSPGLTDVNNRHIYQGYPITGFATQSYTNSNAQPGLLAQYAALFNHTYKRSITSATE